MKSLKDLVERPKLLVFPGVRWAGLLDSGVDSWAIDAWELLVSEGKI